MWITRIAAAAILLAALGGCGSSPRAATPPSRAGVLHQVPDSVLANGERARPDSLTAEFTFARRIRQHGLPDPGADGQTAATAAIQACPEP